MMRVAKVVYENKDWNISVNFWGLLYIPVAKVVYENKDWNFVIIQFLIWYIKKLQKWSTKTRIET